MQLPSKRKSKTAVLSQMAAWRQNDVKWREGKVFSLVFFAGEEASSVAKEAFNLFFSENGLNPTAFPSLRRFETEVVAMTASLLGGNEQTAGNMTSGGTESIILACLAAREWARAQRPEVNTPEIILPTTGHPAFDKAAHYFDMRVTHVPVGADFRADVAATEAAITPNTVLIVGSAPAYPHGVIDPIQELAALAQKHDLLCHVDACVGGLMLPFVRRLGYDLPDFDLSVPGVTSISADLHKYGYAAKGASVILYRNASLRRHQLFATIEWPGGIYASPTLAGTRPGGPIAAAWAIMNYLGEEGYVQITKRVMATVERIREAIDAIDDIEILGEPAMSILAIASDSLDIYEVGDELGLMGWHLDRQHYPASLHLTLHGAHVDRVDEFLRDLRTAVARAKKPSLGKTGRQILLNSARLLVNGLPSRWVSRLFPQAAAKFSSEGEGVPKRSAAMYGMMANLPNRGDIKEVVLDLVEEFTTQQK
ncbi:MAG: aspartate aminotransferase family protein [Ardenticatenaceae bacterium]|nr:aspartate aminotransferase family protein [Ardenticatenaceae bacterium]